MEIGVYNRRMGEKLSVKDGGGESLNYLFLI